MMSLPVWLPGPMLIPGVSGPMFHPGVSVWGVSLTETPRLRLPDRDPPGQRYPGQGYPPDRDPLGQRPP